MAGSLLSSKIVVTEEEASTRSIAAAATSVVGAVGITQRGPIGVATLVNSWDEYKRIFGGFTLNSDVALAVYGFFLNGGSQMYVVRTCHYTNDAPIAAKATATFDDGSGTPVPAVRFDGKTEGAYGNAISVTVKAATNGVAADFDVVVSEDGRIVETFPNLSMTPTAERFVSTIINSASAGSNYVAATSLDSTSPYVRPANASKTLTGGDDGLTGLADADFIGDSSLHSGIYALDLVQDLSLLIVPGQATAGIHATMIAYCETAREGAVFAVLDPPASSSASDIVTYVSTTASLESLSEFGAIYWPRIKVVNPNKAVLGTSDQIVVAPSGYIVGLYARNDGSQPGGIYITPAGIEDGRVLGAVGLETTDALQEAKRDLVYPHRINPITTAPGLPIYVDGSRTLKGGGNFPYIGERRGAIFIEQSVKSGLQFARHKNNTEALRAQVYRTTFAFLLDQMRNGAFRTQVPASAFYVDVSDTLNPPSVVFQGKLKAKVGIATNKPAEFIILSFSQDTRALDEELAAAGA